MPCSGRPPCVVERDRALRLGFGLQGEATNGATLARTLDSNYRSNGSKIVAPWDSLLETILCHQSDCRGVANYVRSGICIHCDLLFGDYVSGGPLISTVS